MKEKALSLMASQTHCVISSLGPNGEPQAALVGFSEDDDFNLGVGTYRDSRKSTNIKADERVAIVVADEDSRLEIQYQGRATIKSASDLGERLELHFRKIPSARKRMEDVNQIWVSITPTWIRYVDANTSPVSYEEITL